MQIRAFLRNQETWNALGCFCQQLFPQPGSKVQFRQPLSVCIYGFSKPNSLGNNWFDRIKVDFGVEHSHASWLSLIMDQGPTGIITTIIQFITTQKKIRNREMVGAEWGRSGGEEWKFQLGKHQI